MNAEASLRAALDRDGFACVSGLLGEDECDFAIRKVAPFAGRAGSRELLAHASFASIARRLMADTVIAEAMPQDAVCVQCTLFAKTPRTNWSVAPHQDLSIPVRERREASGYGGWSVKEGVCFVQPPTALLESMVAVRLQLDAPAHDAGALTVFPGSHRRGRLDPASISALKRSTVAVECVVPRGGAVLIRPLAVHASGKSKSSAMRRVLHFLFGPRHLPQGLEWANAV